MTGVTRFLDGSVRATAGTKLLCAPITLSERDLISPFYIMVCSIAERFVFGMTATAENILLLASASSVELRLKLCVFDNIGPILFDRERHFIIVQMVFDFPIDSDTQRA